MDELKAYLLPCNLEQLNDRINNLGVGIAQMGEQDTIRVHKEFLVATLGYMEELFGMRRDEENRRAASENPPLTLEQIRQMDGEPVWISEQKNGGQDLRGQWEQFAYEEPKYNLMAFWEFGSEVENTYDIADYGKTWLAYTRKPAGE